MIFLLFVLLNFTTFAQQNRQYNIIAISAGSDHTLALRDDGNVWAWGDNEYGQLGNGTVISSNKPIQVKGLSNVIAIAGGERHSLALKRDGTVWAWGGNEKGTLGNGYNDNSHIPVQVKGLKDIIAINAGYNNSVAIKRDGTIWVWGENQHGQLGNDGYDSNLPIKIVALDNVKKATFGFDCSFAIKNDGTFWTWGWKWNIFDHLQADFDKVIAKPYEVKIPNIKEVYGNTKGIIFLDSNGFIWEWEYGKKNQTRIKTINDVIKIARGYFHVIVIKNDGTVFAWGFNDQGQLGDSTTKDRAIPVKIQGLNNIITVTAGLYHSAALSKDGTVWTWGLNDRGQLGDGTNQNRTQPVKVVFEFQNPKMDDKTTIMDIRNWRHPTKGVFETCGFQVVKVELFKNKTYPVFYVKADGSRNIDNPVMLSELAEKNGYWDYKIVDVRNEASVEVHCDRQGKKIIRAVSN